MKVSSVQRNSPHIQAPSRHLEMEEITWDNPSSGERVALQMQDQSNRLASSSALRSVHPSLLSSCGSSLLALESSSNPYDSYDDITQGRIPLETQHNERIHYRSARIFAQLIGAMNPCVSDRSLVATRQARALAGLDTLERDVQIAQRAMHYPGYWGWLGRRVEISGWRDELYCDRLERLGWDVVGSLRTGGNIRRIQRHDDTMDYVLDETFHGPTRVCVLISLLDRVCVAHNSREYRWRRQQTTGGRGKHIYRSTSDRAIARMFCPNAPSSSTEHPLNPAPSGYSRCVRADLS